MSERYTSYFLQENAWAGYHELYYSISFLNYNCKTVKHLSIQFNPIQSNPIQSNPIQSNPIQSSPVQSSSVQFSLIFNVSFLSHQFLASRWVTDSDAYPLEYEFGFVDDSGVFQPWATQTSNEYKISAPPGYGTDKKLTLKMKVKDAFGSRKWMEKIITVNPATKIDEKKVEDLINSRLQEAKDNGDYSKAVPEMMNILQAVKRNSLASSKSVSACFSQTALEIMLLYLYPYWHLK